MLGALPWALGILNPGRCNLEPLLLFIEGANREGNATFW